MKVCSALNCILPARWKPRAIVNAGAHWTDMAPRTLRLPVCFCDLHKSTSTLDKLFTANSRRQLDIQFCKQNMAPIEWPSSVLEWELVDPRDGKVVTFPPADRPVNGAEPTEGKTG